MSKKTTPTPTKDKASFDPNRLTKKRYESELERMEKELVKLQEWVRAKKLRVVVVFEGRDAAGKGGVIKTISGCLNPRVCRVVALAAPTDREKGQWYFQRYITQLPSERSGTVLLKYWFSVSDDEQEKRFHARIENPVKRWKLSPMDLEARARWVDYSIAKDEMFAKTDTSEARWWVVPADEKKRARLNCIAHFLDSIRYEDLTPKRLKLPPRQKAKGYKRPAEETQHFVPEKY